MTKKARVRTYLFEVPQENVKLQATKKTTQVTDDELEIANRILIYLGAKVTPLWVETLDLEFEASESEVIQRNVGVAMARLDVRRPLGTYVNSTYALRDAMGITDTPTFKNAIALLKNYDRIVQCGRGRGKAIVLVSDKLLNVQTTTVQTIPVNTPPKPIGKATVKIAGEDMMILPMQQVAKDNVVLIAPDAMDNLTQELLQEQLDHPQFIGAALARQERDLLGEIDSMIIQLAELRAIVLERRG